MNSSSSNLVGLDQKGVVENFKDKDGIEQVLIRSPRGASLLVSLHGGQVLSWKTDRGEELLFISTKTYSAYYDVQIVSFLSFTVSKFVLSIMLLIHASIDYYQSKFKPPNSVRGGIPICFPQFGKGGAMEQHGFARNKMWVTETDPPALPPQDYVGKSFVDLLLQSNDADMKIWPHRFEFRLRVALSHDGNITMIPRVRNINGKPFVFSFAFHTYFSVSDISEVRVEGLETLDYLDNLFQRERFTEQGDALTFESEVDRVYVDSKDVVAVYDHEKKRTFHIRKEGLPDVAVWNPWDKKAKSMTDFGDDEYKRMLCVDGAAAEKPITLKPGEEWTGRLELIFVRAS